MVELAVILAGGRGERVRPVTDVIPKALIPIDGIPILSRQISQLERVGIRDVIVLTGYLSESIDKYCRNQFNSMNVRCIASNPAFSPAERLLASKEIIGDDFLLVYCDNLATSDIDIKSVLNGPTSVTFLLESRNEGNVEILSDETAIYHAGKRNAKHAFVEMGNICIRSKKFFQTLSVCQDLPSTLESISKEYGCNFVVAKNEILSISNFDRYLSLQKDRSVVILDRDGVLVKKMEKRKYLTSIQEYEPIESNWEGLLTLSKLGVDFLIATNQPGIALGEVDPEFLFEFHQILASDLLGYGIRILSVYTCPHHWDDECGCRKPKPGMLLQAIEDFHLKGKKTLYIGDDDRDLEAATSAGIPGILLGVEHNQKHKYPNLLSAISEVTELL